MMTDNDDDDDDNDNDADDYDKLFWFEASKHLKTSSEH